MDVTATMNLLKSNLQTSFAGILVTRDAQDFQKYSKDQRRAGVITIVADRARELNSPDSIADLAGKFSIYYLYEFERAENTTGSAIEDLESAHLVALQAFGNAPGAGLCPLDVLTAQFSQQRSTPQGWLFAQLDFSQLD